MWELMWWVIGAIFCSGGALILTLYFFEKMNVWQSNSVLHKLFLWVAGGIAAITGIVVYLLYPYLYEVLRPSWASEIVTRGQLAAFALTGLVVAFYLGHRIEKINQRLNMLEEKNEPDRFED